MARERQRRANRRQLPLSKILCPSRAVSSTTCATFLLNHQPMNTKRYLHMHWTESVIANLDNIWVPHRNFELAKGDLFSAALVEPGRLIAFEGPTRAGKSALVEKFSAELCGKLGSDQQFMPFVSMVAENSSTNGLFSSKAFTLSALQAVRHPMFSL